jgi:hypothetical protein
MVTITQNYDAAIRVLVIAILVAAFGPDTGSHQKHTISVSGLTVTTTVLLQDLHNTPLNT